MSEDTGTRIRHSGIRGCLSLLAAVSVCGPSAALDPQRAVTQYAEDRWTAADGLPTGSVEALAQDSVGYLWIRMSGGIVRFDGHSFTPVDAAPSVFSPGSARRITSLEDRDGNLWRAVAASLERSSAAEGSPVQTLALGEDSSLTAAITTLLEDREGSLWIGTVGEGLFRLQNGRFLLWGAREGLSSSAARTVFRDRSGALWVGTDGGGLNRIANGSITTFTASQGLASDVVLAVYESSPGTLWIGTAGGGLSRLQDGSITNFSTRDGLTSAAVTSLLRDRQGNLWIGTAGGGLNRFRRGRFDAFTTEDGLSNDIVRALYQDRGGDLWIGTDAGLNRFRNEPSQISTYSTADGLASDQILALHQDREGILWIGTDAGLSRRTEGGFVSFTRREGLFNNSLRQILDDRRNRLWFCSNKGLFYLEKNSLETTATEPRRLVARAIPTARDLGCSGYSQPAAWQDEDGTMWFATNAGAVEVDPERFSPPAGPPIVLEKVWVDGRPLPVGSRARLPAGTRDIEFHYTTLALVDGPLARFRYRLDPFDQAWIANGNRRRTRYTNLPAGSFRFRVAASVGGAWSPSEAEFQLDVPKPFYRTKAAVSAVFLLALIFSRGIYQLRIQQLVRRNLRLTERVAESTRQVEQQKQELDRANQRLAVANRKLETANEELFELDQENTDFLALAAHDLREPLVTLQGFAGELHGILGVLRKAALDRPTSLPEDRREIVREVLEEDAPEALGFIDASTERMGQLIQGLVSLSQLGRQKLHFEQLSVEGIVREVLRSLGYQISRRGVEVEIRELPPVVADRASLKLVFENLLNNAVLYLDADRPGKIVLSGEAGDDGCSYRVEDNGRGIPEADRPKIFQVFGRGDSAHVPGEGLGLAFVRATLERHGGSIDFRSEPGQGTVFFFSLPHLQPEDSDA